ncbi:hypothetical protein KUTeg_021554 [Tegillarca granosa]|uniref:CUB domain-containing protein n=1 Tax=Tegillarca granosa TaxID=220873 RepID=A0ABQ9E4G9_TEGGR|nr:hypothetical protein KUTeg_021554 [Tegillarca granosa]
MRCTVTIYAPPGQKLLLVFRSLDIEFEPNCDDDFMKLYDGNSTSAYRLSGLPKRICGSRKPTGSFSTSGEALTVFFKSDSWSNENGFQLIFTSFHEAN